MVHIVRERPSAHLVIVGGSAGFAGGDASRSPEESRLLSVVRDEGLMNHVTFTGRIAHAKVTEMYALAAAVAYPRRLTRTTALTTPLKPLEPMAMAIPVIASDIPPMRELVEDGQTGLLFRAGDVEDLAAKCVQLLKDPVLQRRLGTNARAWVLRKRRWEMLVSGYQNVYESVGRPAGVGSSIPIAEARVRAGVGK
jgi:glycosyltransferase involved in cell wall biosynthesis